MRKHGGFQKGGTSPRDAIASDLCHKCGKVGHFMRDYLMDKAWMKEYPRLGGEKIEVPKKQ